MNSTTTNSNNNNNGFTVIPTRFIDRRVSQSAIQQDPHKFNVNYSEAGSYLARAAQEQLKVAEQIKEAKKEAQKQQLEQLKSNKKDNLSGENTGEDWQNVSFILFFLIDSNTCLCVINSFIFLFL